MAGMRSRAASSRRRASAWAWRKWVNKVTERVEEFASFEEFVREPLPDGLGSEIRTLKHLCQDDPGALDAIDRATVGGHGTNQYTKGLESNNITLQDTPKPQTGTSNTYALRRLRKDRPDLHERVLAEEAMDAGRFELAAVALAVWKAEGPEGLKRLSSDTGLMAKSLRDEYAVPLEQTRRLDDAERSALLSTPTISLFVKRMASTGAGCRTTGRCRAGR
jgi:hypothetical protein